ncbi:hypothetical protein LEP1GSC036_2661 [Leptospira weilii str. 2006001853]|uniref:Uncharacterized protein n=1 Tax=Leptospira weilii str. 2006001853 TaxID=1001589 RepID=A0A828Z4Q5_9LEPT|nr:hypothetical protein [Leptospira weilii]EKR64537.1 hypothetical protein LEP1GSC036_2661 [Leptospira weilii str. 2006001853]EMN45062.1 hypothetical protein LEP1GSC086_2715 [Leptospira weilii str. LNT 1234]QDK23012.1 hypothetical protein FHG67_10010 [Leptospira weilii]QDK27344.1 hypothetical protein FHG68_12225 [Leptospira weilii]
MELFAVLAINAFVSVVLYYTITSKVTEKIRNHMLKRINEEIRDFVDELETESLRQVDLIGSRILTFKEMTSKAEELVKRIEQATTPDILDKIQIQTESPNLSGQDSYPPVSDLMEEGKKSLKSPNVTKVPGSIQQGIGHIYKENLDLVREEGEAPTVQIDFASIVRKNTAQNSYIRKPNAQKDFRPQIKSETISEGSTSNLVLETIGRGVRKFFGIQEIKTIRKEDSSANDFFPGTRNSTLDISLDEDPFSPVSDFTLSDTPVFKDNLKSADFGRILQENITGYKPLKPDSTRISAEAALLEIGEDSTKIEKVVFLLKRKYTHEEISEVLDLALGEVDIIERFRLDRNRRF